MPTGQRLLFLDNLRYIMVLLVLLFHVAAGYSGLPEFFNETNAGGPFRTFRDYLAAIPRMPILFFVSGFFALSSLERHGFGGLMRSKFLRLGLPWLLCIVFIGPLMPYMGYYSRSFQGLAEPGYWAFWSQYLASAFNQWISPIVYTTNNQFHQQHYWFTSFLLQFFVVFGLLWAGWKKWGFARSRPLPQPTEWNMGWILLGAALLISVLRQLLWSLNPPHGVVAFFVHFSPMGAAEYGVFFALGIYTRSAGWFVDGRVPKLRTGAFLVAAFALIWGFEWLLDAWSHQAGPQALFATVPPRFLSDLINSLSRNLKLMLYLVFFVGLAHQFMNRPSTLNAQLTVNSYYLYLLHYPLILVFRLLVFAWDGPTLVKFIFVLLGAGLASYALSHYLIRPHGRWAVAGLVALHLGICLFGLPPSADSHLLANRSPELAAVVPQQRPQLVAQAPSPQLDAMSGATPYARAHWQDPRLLVAFRHRGLYQLTETGPLHPLNPALDLETVASLPNGDLAAVEPSSRRILHLDTSGQLVAALVDSAGLPATRFLAVTGSGGLYFTTGEDTGRVYFRSPQSTVRPAINTPAFAHANGLALSPDGQILYVNTLYQPIVWAMSVGANGDLGPPRFFAELIRGDGRYGKEGPWSAPARAQGMTTDSHGRLFVAARYGIQVFAPAGRLLGHINFPDIPVSWNPGHPLSCVFGGPDLSTLYATWGGAVYAVTTRTQGVSLSGP